MMATDLLKQLAIDNVRLKVDGERLIVDAPEEWSNDKLLNNLIALKPEVLKLLQAPTFQPDDEAEIIWRVEAMRLQMPERPPYPFFVARKESQWKKGHCHSCGDALNPESLYRCGYCVSAIYLLFGLTEGAKPVSNCDVQGLN